jgi:hypothetical protein
MIEYYPISGIPKKADVLGKTGDRNWFFPELLTDRKNIMKNQFLSPVFPSQFPSME